MKESSDELNIVIQNYLKRNSKRFSEPKYQCCECDGGMCMDEYIEIVHCTKSFRHFYICNKCGHMEYGP